MKKTLRWVACSYITLDVVIRALNDDDAGAAAELSGSAGWNQLDLDWCNLFLLSNCFGIEAEGQLVASISVTCYGNDLAWIGMVLTLPQHRGKGYASQLMSHAMDFLLERRIRCIKLDATELGAPVYRKFGFEDECLVERWKGGSVRPDSEGSVGPINASLDRAAFGADRLALLETLKGGQYRVEDEAHAFLREGRNARQFGPCVATTVEAATRLAGFGTAYGQTFWDLFPGNPQAVQLAHSFGFTPARKLLRMSYKGLDVDQDPSKVYALAGFEWG
jgi:GNAT superfamily N-acetyltransferase